MIEIHFPYFLPFTFFSWAVDFLLMKIICKSIKGYMEKYLEASQRISASQKKKFTDLSDLKINKSKLQR